MGLERGKWKVGVSGACCKIEDRLTKFPYYRIIYIQVYLTY
jgi:hypothetical protein